MYERETEIIYANLSFIFCVKLRKGQLRTFIISIFGRYNIRNYISDVIARRRRPNAPLEDPLSVLSNVSEHGAFLLKLLTK